MAVSQSVRCAAQVQRLDELHRPGRHLRHPMAPSNVSTSDRNDRGNRSFVFQKWKFILLVHGGVDADDVHLRFRRVVQKDLGSLHAIAGERRVDGHPAGEPLAAGALRLLVRRYVECRLANGDLSICCDHTRHRLATALGEECSRSIEQIQLKIFFLGGVQRRADGGENIRRLPQLSSLMGKSMSRAISSYHLTVILLQSVTQCLVLAVCMAFLFLRIHFVLKLVVASIIGGVYYYIIYEAVEHIYDVSV